MSRLAAVVALVAAVLIWPSTPVAAMPLRRGARGSTRSLRSVGAGAAVPGREAAVPGREAAVAGSGSGPVRVRRWGRCRPSPLALADARDLLELLDLLRAGVLAGLPPGRALALASIELGEGSRVGRAIAATRDVDGIPDWAAVEAAVGGGVVSFVGQALALSERAGVPMAEAVDTAARLVRAEVTRSGRLAVLMAGPRATARLLTLLPLGGVLLAAGFGVDPIRLYAASPASRGCLVGGVLLVLLGRWWTGRLIAGVGS